MIHPLQRTDVVAVEDDLAFQFVPVLLDLIVLDHDDDHIHVVQKLVKIVELVRDDVLLDEGVIDLQRAAEMLLLAFQELQGRALAAVIYILLVSQAVQPHATIV